MTRTFQRICLLAAGAAVACAATGCASADLVRVKPWERAALADYTMQPDRDPLQVSFTEHIFFSREAAHGGRSVGGSGCGCN
jgi:hypothetical protein